MPPDPSKVAARHRVNYAVQEGRLPRASTLLCTDCGRPASEYDHHLGYDRSVALAVQPVCKPCHTVRARARGEPNGRPRSADACSNCGKVTNRYTNGRCPACNTYLYKTGRERPSRLFHG